MARPREFDETAVLEAAIQCFWSRGYEATSVRDLAKKMALTGASMYNAFGDKRSLYRRALDHYVEQSFGDRVGRIERSTRAVRRRHRNVGLVGPLCLPRRSGLRLIGVGARVVERARADRTRCASPEWEHERQEERGSEDDAAHDEVHGGYAIRLGESFQLWP